MKQKICKGRTGSTSSSFKCLCQPGIATRYTTLYASTQATNSSYLANFSISS